MISTEVSHPSPDEAFAECARITRAHYENFPVASLFLPQEQRPYIQAIYAFSRTADDFADETDSSPEERLAKLDDWEFRLRECYEGRAEHPVFIALRETVRKTELPIDPLLDLLTAFKRDVTQNRYQSFGDLLSYCRCSANPVGRIILMLFGYRDEKLFSHSDDICTALQLTNFWQDIAIDRLKDRCYLPLEDLEVYHYSLDDWQNNVMNKHFRNLLEFQISRTREMFIRGSGLPSLVNRELRLELKLIWFGGMRILRQIEKNRYDVWNNRPVLSLPAKFGILSRGLIFDTLPPQRRKSDPWDLTQ